MTVHCHAIVVAKTYTALSTSGAQEPITKCFSKKDTLCKQIPLPIKARSLKKTVDQLHPIFGTCKMT